jgi:hypothetical protein
MTARFRRFVAGLTLFFTTVFAADASAQRVALLAAEYTARALDVRAQLIRAGLTDITVIDATVGSPTAAELLQYDVVYTWSDLPYGNPTALGNALADYVDQGGGVVQGVFSFYTTPGGRWSTGMYAPFSTGFSREGFSLTLVPVVAHPILNGVTSFDGGFSSYHHSGISAQGCATVIANWSNGQPLVAVRRGPNGGRIVGLNMYAPSANAYPYFWNILTDGHILMANALKWAAVHELAPVGPPLALVGADETTDLEKVKCQLADLRLFSRVDTFDARTTVPNAALLSQYAAVLTWADVPYGNSTALGNALADYVDLGGAVVQGAYRPYPAPGGRLDGRWSSGGYLPFSEATATSAVGLSLVQNVPGHFVFNGVPSFTGGAGSYHHSPIALASATSVIGSWSDGQPMIGAGSNPARRVVGLNLAPASSDARLVANTVLFAANHFPTVNAGADQTVEATSPSGASFAVNASASDVDGDPLSYIWSGAISTTGPSITIDLPPPAAPSKTQSHTLTLTVTDSKGAETADSVTLTVTDMTGPVLNGVPASSLVAEATGSSGAEVFLDAVTAADAVDGGTAVLCSPASGMFPIGDTSVTCSSSDSRGNSSNATFTVRVTDTTAPVFAGMPAGILTAEATSAAGAPVTYGPVTANDLVDGATPVTCSPSGPFPVGDTAVTCSSRDSHNNVATAAFTVRVTDTTAPVLSGVPTGVLTVEATGASGAQVSYGPVTATDLVDGPTPVNCAPAGTFPVGDTQVTCSSTDSHNNAASAGFIVRVTDTGAPVLSGVPTGIVSVEATGASGAQVAYGPVTAVDLIDGPTPVSCVPPPGMFPVGDTPVTCSSRDSHNNVASASFTVRVTDTRPPVLSGVPSGVLTVEATSSSGAQVSYGPVTATDLVDGPTPVNCAPPSGMFPIGDTQVTCTSSDSHKNVASASFTVRVTNPADPSVAGAMEGHGLMKDGHQTLLFDFTVFETATGQEGGSLNIKIPSKGELRSTAVTYVLFSGNSVTFRGTATWNGTPGVTFEVYAADNGNGSQVDFLRITTNPPLESLSMQGRVNGAMIHGRRR